jgi:glycosyltransferase involved in cell wall biosynthesis
MTGHEASRVTVIIPVWGRYTGVVGAAVGSARAGSVAVRVVVVDNANAPALTELDGAEIVRSEVRLSRGASRNVGLAEVQTEYVVFLDADDVLLPGGLDHLVAGLDRHPSAGAFVGRIVEGSGAVHRLPRSLCPLLARVPRLLAWTNAIWPVMSIQGCAVMRTAAVRAAGGYPDASSGEDWALATALAFGGPVAFTAKPVLRYWLHGDSPGVRGPTARVLSRSARVVRRGLAARGARRPAMALLAAVQTIVILGLRPPARLTRRSVAALTAEHRRG